MYIIIKHVRLRLTIKINYIGMKNRHIKVIAFLFSIMVFSCNIPDTIVTNIIHRDGSVTRIIEMKNSRNKFDNSVVQVPYDSTWNIHDTLVINSTGDTTWVRRAWKIFADTAEINRDYMADSSANKSVSRRSEFRKKFRWFSTHYRYAEIIDKELQGGYPVGKFLDEDEQMWFYSPVDVNENKLGGPDSLVYRALRDSVISKTERWSVTNIVSLWIEEFGALADRKPGSLIDGKSLKSREAEFTEIIMNDLGNFDSLWSDGTLLGKFIGPENVEEYRNDADSAFKHAVEKVLIDFSSYSTRTILPGKLMASNGYTDSTGAVLWPVKSDYFLTETYEMWAESRVRHIWAWILTFSLFTVLIALTFVRRRNRGS